MLLVADGNIACRRPHGIIVCPPLCPQTLISLCPPLHSSLARKFPDRAKDLFAKSEAAAQARFDHLQKLVELYK